MREAIPPHSIIIRIYRKPLRSITDRLELGHKGVVRLDGSRKKPLAFVSAVPTHD
jgi:hypothetical protein